tara:strand:+ start:38 stop:1195 length:1158 start_codon:yes stop_codon:yes gene_type:complete
MSGFHVNGTDLDHIFIKKSSAYPGINTSSSASQAHFEVDGVDLNQRYVAKANTYPNNGTAAATGYHLENGSDLNTIFAANYEWDTYNVEAAGSAGGSYSSNTRFGNNPNVNSQYGAIITCAMDLIKTYNGMSVSYEIKDCYGGQGGTTGYSGRIGANGGNTVALIDQNNDECIIVAGAGGGGGNGNGGPGGAAYNDTLNMTDWNNPIFYYLIQDPLLDNYMYPGGTNPVYTYNSNFQVGASQYITSTFKYAGGSNFYKASAGYYYGLNAKNCFTYGGGGGTNQGGTGGIDGGATAGGKYYGGKGGDANSDSRSAGGGGGGAGYYGGGGGTNVNTGDGTRGSPGGGGGSSYINPNYNSSSINIAANGNATCYIKINGSEKQNGFTL